MATTLLLRMPADAVRDGAKIELKIIVPSLNLTPTPPPGQIFNAHPLDYLDIARKVIL